MAKTKYLKGECQHCQGHVEFPAESIGLYTPCPHCGRETELMLSAPTVEPTIPRRVIVWTAAAVLLLVAGLVATLAGLRHFQNQAALMRAQAAAAARQAAATQAEAAPKPEDPVAKAGFQVSAVTLEKTQGSSLIYAVGTVKNATDHQRFGVRIEFDLYDGADHKVGTAKDYQAMIEPGAEWKFKALVVDSKAVSAKLASIKEDQ
jgi:Tfp pilus assembly protein PilV